MFTDKLKAVRERLGLTQSEVARRLGWSRQRYNKYEHGARRVALSQAERIASVLGVTLGELAGEVA